jgi:predicted nuclease of predicted toxin-antitoxin system
VKLLFDANLSPSLVAHLHSHYPGSLHVRDVGLRAGSDAQIWEHAKAEGFVIVSKDTDFRERSFIEGFPPKVVWLDLGNAGTIDIATRLRIAQAAVATFLADPEESLLVISPDGHTV